MKNKIISLFKNMDSSHKFNLLYFSIVFLLLNFVNEYINYCVIIIGSFLLYGFISKEKESHAMISFLIFIGMFSIFNVTLLPNILEVPDLIEYQQLKNNSEKAVDLGSTEIYIDKAKNKSYVFYKINNKTFLDIDNLISEDNSEIILRYSELYNIDNYSLAFSTYKNEIYSDGIFKIPFQGENYIVKAYIPSDKYLELLSKAGFKNALQLEFETEIQNIFINKATQEVAFSNNNVLITSKYIETPYNKEDYFSYRYDIFNDEIKDETIVNKNLNVSLLKTFSNVSNDIKRVTFYSESSEFVHSGIVEIIFENKAYVFRTGLIDVEKILSIKRN